MGEIRISDDSSEERYPSALLDGTIELRLDEDHRPTLVISEEAPFSDTDVEVAVRDIGQDSLSVLEGPWKFLIVPTLAGLLTVGVAVTGVVDAVLPDFSSAIHLGLTAFVVLTGTTGTLLLYTDADELAARGADWTPSPWSYLVPGALVVAMYIVWSVQGPESTPLRATALAGIAVVSLAVSSVPTGPIYVYNRYRNVGLE